MAYFLVSVKQQSEIGYANFRCYTVHVVKSCFGPRTETCRSVFNVLMCKFYKFI